MDEWYRRYADKEMKDVKYLPDVRARSGHLPLHQEEGAVLPTDMNGLKFRPPNAVIASWMRSLGATNVQAAAPEIRDVLEKGVAEGAGSPWGSMGLFGIDKVTQFHIDAPIYVSEQVWVLNTATYAKLSPAQKKVMDDHCSSDWSLKIATPWAELRVRRPGKDQGAARAGGLSADARATRGLAQVGRADRRQTGKPT